MSENARLDRQIDREELAQCVKITRLGGCDGIVGELLKYGGSGITRTALFCYLAWGVSS